MKVIITVICLIQLALIASLYIVIVIFRSQIIAHHKLIGTQAKAIRAMGKEIDGMYAHAADYVVATDRKFNNLKNWAYSQEEMIWYFVNHPEGRDHDSV